MVTIMISIIIYFLVNFILASLMNPVAADKGYENSNVFVVVLLFGAGGILYVISLPDLVARQQREDILALLLEQNEENKNGTN